MELNSAREARSVAKDFQVLAKTLAMKGVVSDAVVEDRLVQGMFGLFGPVCPLQQHHATSLEIFGH